jgi:aconitate hydratase
MATIGNMSAEIDATSTLFPYEATMGRYLDATGRSYISKAAADNINLITADEGSNKYYDEIIEIDLEKLEPQINDPYFPDLANPLSTFSSEVEKHCWPEKLSASLVGSCTNSSFEDLMKVANLVEQARSAGFKLQTPFFVSTGSEQIRANIEKFGILDTLRNAGAVVLSSSCGPCVGQWHRTDVNVKEVSVLLLLRGWN